ncbi:MAG: hypothetical protein ACYCPS_02785 [Candidatus Saccharimonadales bacterium]
MQQDICQVFRQVSGVLQNDLNIDGFFGLAGRSTKLNHLLFYIHYFLLHVFNNGC